MLMCIILKRILLVLSCLLWFRTTPAICASPTPRLDTLVRQSDFVGIVTGAPLTIAPKSEWKQHIFLYEIDALKGDLLKDIIIGQYPWVLADHAGFSGYPTWFAAKGEYLVFLRWDKLEGRPALLTLAAFPLNIGQTRLGRLSDES